MTSKMNTLAKRFIHIAAGLALALAPVASRAADGSQLKPPPGARVAIVMFEDLECPRLRPRLSGGLGSSKEAQYSRGVA